MATPANSVALSVGQGRIADTPTPQGVRVDAVATQAIVRKWLDEFAGILKRALRTTERRPADREFLALIDDNKLKHERLALCILSGALRSIGKNESYADKAGGIADNIRIECVHAKIIRGGERRLARRIERSVSSLPPGASKQRSAKARRAAERQGFKTEKWGEADLVEAGNWAINQLLLLPDVFHRDDDSGQERHLTLTPEAARYVDAFVEALLRKNPERLPETQPPKPWMGWRDGGAWG